MILRVLLIQKNSAIYGQFDGNITKKVKIIGGLRFEKRKADYTR